MPWSYSAHRSLRTCQRQFAFGHIVASAVAKDIDRHEAHILKQLQHPSQWRGTIVHHVLATSFMDDLRAGREPGADRLTAIAHDLARRQYAFSAAGRYREPTMTKAASGEEYCALYAHEHGLDISEEEIAGIFSDIACCFQYLTEQREFMAYMSSGSDFRSETIVRFRVDGRAAVAKLDLLFSDSEGRPVIVDWKIGDSATSHYAPQLYIYALALERSGRWPGLVGASAELYEVNLLRGELRHHTNSPHLIEEAEDLVYEGVLEHERLFGSGSYNDLDLDDLNAAVKPTTCQYCGFAPLCLQTLTRSDEVDQLAIIQGRLL